MLVLVALGLASAALLASALTNQQHVSRDRSYTQSLGVAEAGLNQYLWMVASGSSSRSNGYAIAGNTVGLENDSATAVNASGNWWGDASGPSQAGSTM